jgi:hypothetical protein
VTGVVPHQLRSSVGLLCAGDTPILALGGTSVMGNTSVGGVGGAGC